MNASVPVSDQALITLPEDVHVLTIFTTEKAIDPFLAQIRARIDAFDGDASTPEGRKEIASMAYKVARSKTYLEGLGKALADEQKAIPKKIDATRRLINETLDGWRDEVRKPLDEWEQAEASRKEKHEFVLRRLTALCTPGPSPLPELDAERLWAETVDHTAHEEYADEIEMVQGRALLALAAAIDSSRQAEADAAELAELRAAKAAQEAEAAAKAAEEARQREAAAAQEREAERLRLAEERARQDAEAAAAKAIEDAQRAAALAEARAAEAERRARDDLARQQAAEEAARRAREADREHRATVNREARDAIMKSGVSQEHAQLIVAAIASGAIPHVSITY